MRLPRSAARSSGAPPGEAEKAHTAVVAVGAMVPAGTHSCAVFASKVMEVS